MVNWEGILSALSKKTKLISGCLMSSEGGVCAVGALGQAAGIDVRVMIMADWDRLIEHFNIPGVPVRDEKGVVEAMTWPILSEIMRTNDRFGGTDEDRLMVVRRKVEGMRDLDEEYQAKLRMQARDSIEFTVLPEPDEMPACAAKK
jgi:hypothetical protein